MSKVTSVNKIKLLPAKCAVDLGDGSERGEYVNQDYILQKLGRPHRCINLMYCYYPLDKGWPQRASVAFKDTNASFAWDFPYDDYFPYGGGIGGNTNGEPFTFMKDVRKHGQDVTLTLAMDCAVSDEHLIKIAKELRTFGRMQLRINHEATGDWFAFSKRYSFKEISDFYVRFHNIIKKEAPHIQTVLCIGGIEQSTGKIEGEDAFKEAIKVTDFWSGDFYLSLHWGWPYDIAERGGNSHKLGTVDEIHELTKRVYDRFTVVNDGIPKPMVISELNADGDVNGPVGQAEMVKEFYEKIRDKKLTQYNGIVMYQFRDRGRLGLEIEDPNNSEIGVEQPLLKAYKEIISDPYFQSQIKTEEELKGEADLPVTLRWGGAEDAEGFAMNIDIEAQPAFFEVSFQEDINLMVEINGKWFYKAPGVKTIDMITAFIEKPVTKPSNMALNIFAPPATGENDPSQGEDWLINYYAELKEMPKLRIRYEATEIAKYH